MKHPALRQPSRFPPHFWPLTRTPLSPRHLADSRIPGDDEFAGSQRGLLEIRRIGWKDLPACDLLPEYLNRSHVRKLPAQALMMLLGGAEPHSVVCTLVQLVTQYEDDLIPNIDRQAAEHGSGTGRQRIDRFEHELMRHGLALFGSEDDVLRREKGRIATTLRHRLMIQPVLRSASDRN
jgi:hypothetical protein